MRYLFILIAVAMLALAGCHSTLNTPPDPVIPLFPTEKDAQAHCPTDALVWVDSTGNTYHMKNEHPFGRIFGGGAYGCRGDAVRSPVLRHGNDLSD
jgi:hypothetical protein